MQIGTWINSTRLGSARLGWLLGVRLGSVLVLTQAMLGAPDLGSVITKLDARFDSARSLSRAQLGDRLGTGDWGFGLAWHGA